MKTATQLLLVLALLCLGTTSAIAGVLYARRPGTEAPVYNLRISHIRTNVTIAGQLAVTHVDEEFYNDNNITLEGFYAFQLPDGASVDGLWLWVNGQRLTFVVKTKEEAERLYDSVVVGQRRDPAILESLGKNRFQLKVFPIGPFSARRIELRYFTTLPLTQNGMVHFRYPMNLQGYQTRPVETTSLRIDVESQLPVGAITTNYDDNPMICTVRREGERKFSVDFGGEEQFYSQDFELAFEQRELFSFFPALSYLDPDDEFPDPYFMTWHPVQPSEGSSTQPRDLTFVLDASGSMGSTQISTVRDAVTGILRQLRSIDRFRIVLFSHGASSFPSSPTLLPATEENIEAAVDYIARQYMSGGSTNYEAAFTAALSAGYRSNAVRRMLFLTDGVPTTGKQSNADLLQVIEDNDELGVGIYPVIVYSESIDLLFDIAEARGGKVTIVENGDDLATVISRIMLELDITAIRDATVTYESGQTYFVYPESFPPNPGIDRLITTGRINGTRPELVRLRYTDTDGQEKEIVHTVNYEAVRTDVKQVASYWATAHIAKLIDEYELTGNEEVKKAIVDLSIKHQILTPYTAFLVLETNPIDPPVTVAENVRVLPQHVALQRNYPSPFSLAAHRATTIPFTLTQSAPVHIVITDVLGRVVRVLTDGDRAAGRHSVQWDGRDAFGAQVTPGVYFVRLTSHDVARSLRITVLR
ncbi:MAG: VIT domain-containing protein [Bacteroidota bacterium]|nr:VIT domain-containing protein [Bacteroidota bacterium]